MAAEIIILIVINSVAKIFRDLSEAQGRILVNDLLLEAIKTYWDWWEQYHLNQLMQYSLQNAEKRLTMVKTAYQLGDRPAIDTWKHLRKTKLLQHW